MSPRTHGPRGSTGRARHHSSRTRAAVSVALPADYIVTSNAEWNVVAALSGATLSGKTVELQGTAFTGELAMSTKTMSVPLVIRGAVGNRVPYMRFTAMKKLTVQGVNLQMTGWPKAAGGCMSFYNANEKIKIDTCSFRHGYGSGSVNLTPVVIEAAPEIVRTNNLITATTTSSRVAINKIPADGPSWWVEFFNDGANGVYVAGGDGTVVATTGNTLVAAGSSTRITGNPSHVAVMAVAGTSACNARGEVGINDYLSDAFNSDGATSMDEVEIVNCDFIDVNNAIKAFTTSVTVRIDVWKNRFTRVYQDLISIGTASPACKVAIMLNSGMTPLARSGIAQNLNGDARDPHGDLHQTYYTPNVRSTGGWFIAGNVYWPGGRTGATAQGNFISDNDGGYENVFSVANVLTGGSSRGYSVGDPGVAASGYVFGDGDTILDPSNADGACGVLLYGGTTQNNAFERTIAGTFPLPSQTRLADNIDLGSGNTGIFANWAGVASATSKAAILAALTTGTQVGAADLRGSLINENAATTEDVIQWTNTRPGLSWPQATDLTASTLYTSPLRKVLGGGTGMSIAPFGGAEYQVSNDAAGTVIAQAWTTSPGTVSRWQFVQVRGMTSAVAGASAGLGVTIAGISQPMTALTIEPFFTLAGDMAFTDPAVTSFSPSVGQMTLWAKLRDPSMATTAIFSLASRLCTLDIVSITGGGDIRTTVTDSASTLLKALSTAAVDRFQANTVTEFLWSVDLPNKVARIWVNGVLVATEILAANSGLIGTTNSKMHLLQNVSSTGRFSGQVFGLKMWKGIAVTDGVQPVAVPYKAISGDAAAANADPWKVGVGSAT